MANEWKVTSNFIGGKKCFAVYRLIDAAGVDHSGNREYATDYMESREEAQAIADRKNGKKTVFEAITKDAATLAALLGSLPVLEAPRDTEFHKRYCKKCPSPDCNYCPHERFRNNPAWWLNLSENGVKL